MFAIRIVDRLAGGDARHLIDTAARGIHFDAQIAIGGAGVQAQAAVDAAVEIDLMRLVDMRLVDVNQRIVFGGDHALFR